MHGRGNPTGVTGPSRVPRTPDHRERHRNTVHVAIHHEPVPHKARGGSTEGHPAREHESGPDGTVCGDPGGHGVYGGV